MNLRSGTGTSPQDAGDDAVSADANVGVDVRLIWLQN